MMNDTTTRPVTVTVSSYEPNPFNTLALNDNPPLHRPAYLKLVVNRKP